LQELVGLPLAVGVALAEALGSQAVRVQLKWPNDILRDGKKLGGVLIATAADAEPGAYWCVIGIGINLTVPDQLETEIGHPVADAPWLAQQDRNQLMAVILDHLEPMLHTFERDGMVAFVARWNKYDAYQNQIVQIMDQGQMLHLGRALGIDDMGRLLMDTEQGRIAVLAGDVSLRKSGEGMKDVFADFLLIDAGNTRIKWALVRADAKLGAWAAQGVLVHGAAHEAAAQWQQAGVRQIWVSNVAGGEVREHLAQVLAQALPLVPLHWFVSSASAGGLVNAYRDPAQLGCDRFAAAIGAGMLFPQQALLVVNCGTATTLDAVSDDARFIGGMILPGLGTMAKALNRQTAQLPSVVHSVSNWAQLADKLADKLADNTEDAIISGCLAAQTGAILAGLTLLRAQFGSVLCILSGGAAQMISAALAQPHQVLDNLVLHGLQVVARMRDELDVETRCGN
jgi:type III pantothenate kinase